jgi:hypothetical protein
MGLKPGAFQLWVKLTQRAAPHRVRAAVLELDELQVREPIREDVDDLEPEV